MTFDRALSRTANTHPIGCSAETRFIYEAIVDSTAEYSWYLDYTFGSSYNSGTLEGGTVKLSVQQADGSGGWNNLHSFSFGPSGYFAPDGVYDGDGTFDLVEGNTYRVKVLNGGALKVDSLTSDLLGTVSIDFNGAPIPEPTTMLLIAAGLTGLAAAGRRRSHH